LFALKYNKNEFLPSVEELHTIKQFGFAAAILNEAAVTNRALTIKFKNSLDLPKKFSKFPQISVKFPRQT
jgi:hypothetical protein